MSQSRNKCQTSVSISETGVLWHLYVVEKITRHQSESTIFTQCEVQGDGTGCKDMSTKQDDGALIRTRNLHTLVDQENWERLNCETRDRDLNLNDISLDLKNNFILIFICILHVHFCVK